jgi:hypothetical protein
MYDPATGRVNVTDRKQSCDAAARPDVDPAYHNDCVECLTSYMEDETVLTYVIPLVPVDAATPVQIGPFVGIGLAFNGIKFDAPAAQDAILDAHTLAPFDDCSGHVNLHFGYHYHAVTGCSPQIAATQGHAPIIGFAMGGYPLIARLDANGTEPTDLSFSEYYGICAGAVPDYFSWNGIHNGEKIIVATYTTTDLTNHAVDWVAAQQNPWFVWLAYNAPHSLFHAPPDLHSARDLPDDKDAITANPLPHYNAALEARDTEIGRLLASMPQDVRDNTVVIFIGDNGSPGQIADALYGDRGAKGGIFDGRHPCALCRAGAGRCRRAQYSTGQHDRSLRNDRRDGRGHDGYGRFL